MKAAADLHEEMAWYCWVGSGEQGAVMPDATGAPSSTWLTLCPSKTMSRAPSGEGMHEAR